MTDLAEVLFWACWFMLGIGCAWWLENEPGAEYGQGPLASLLLGVMFMPAWATVIGLVTVLRLATWLLAKPPDPDGAADYGEHE